jgi:hypothetical protein
MLSRTKTFAEALFDLPQWAITAAFEGHRKQSKHFPTPGEIRTRASIRMKDISDDLGRLDRMLDRHAAPENREPTEAELEMRRATAKKILRENGYAGKEEAPERIPSEPHWSTDVPLDDPRMDAVRRARADTEIGRAMIAAGEMRDPWAKDTA